MFLKDTPVVLSYAALLLLFNSYSSCVRSLFRFELNVNMRRKAAIKEHRKKLKLVSEFTFI